MSTDESKRRVREYYERVVGTGEVDRVEAFVSPAYAEVYRGQRYELGIDGAKRHVTGVRDAFPDLRLTVDAQIAEGEWVVSTVTARGTHSGPWLGMAPSGETLEFTAVNIDRVVDGLIVEHGGAANLLEPLLESGVVQITTPADPG